MYRRAIRRKQRINGGAVAPQPAPSRAAWSPLTSLAGVPPREPLVIGAANDPAERQADAAADRVMRPGAAAVPAIAQASPGAAIRREAAGGSAAGGMVAGPRAQNALSGLGAGTPLPAAERAFFEPRFGADLSKIRIHADGAGAAASQAIAARAFTLGTDIGFAAGEYRPGTSEGRRLMAHEIAHAMQDGGAVVRRTPCASAVPGCSKEKLEKAKKAVASKKKTSFTFGAATATCGSPIDMAETLKQADAGLFTGSATKYAADVVKINKVDPAKIGPGKCLAFPKGWVDPNIGDIDAELKSLRGKKGTALKNKIIAGVYAEMTLDTGTAPDADLQRAYILYSMLLRVKDERFKPKLSQIAVSGTYHAIGGAGDYSDAVAYLEDPKAKTPKGLNTAAIDKVKTLVDTISEATIPGDAGPYYFHWREGGAAETTTAKTEYAAQIAAKKTPAEAEYLAARKQARDVVGAKDADRWVKKIPGANKGKTDDRIGSMYIYK